MSVSADDIPMHDEAREDAEENNMEGVTEISTSSVNPDMEKPCSNCPIVQAEMLAALENADKAARLQAKLQTLLKNVHVLAKDQADASVQLEGCLKVRGELRTKIESLQAHTKKKDDEKTCLKRSIKKLEQELPVENYYLEEEDGWKESLARCKELLDEQPEKYVFQEARLKRVRDMDKHCREVLARQHTDESAVNGKLQQQLKVNRKMKKNLASVTPILADIYSQCSDTLPDHLLTRLKKFPMDELLQLSKAKDDDHAEDFDAVLEHIMETDSGRYRFTTKPGGKGSRGGRGAYRARWAAKGAERKVVDESMHEELLDRKLHRNDPDVVHTEAPAEPAAKSVMGRKMETVRELQERQKGDIKNVIAELKKDEERNAASTGEKSSGSARSLLAPRTGLKTAATDSDLFELGGHIKMKRQSTHMAVFNGSFSSSSGQQKILPKKGRDVDTWAPPRAAKSAPLELSALGLIVSDSSDED